MEDLVSRVEKGDAIGVARLLRNYPHLPNGIEKQSLLHKAVSAPCNCWTMIEILLEKRVPINVPDKAGSMALHIAVDKGHVKCLQVLIRFGAKINEKDKDGRTPLHYAARNHSRQGIKCLQILLEEGSQCDIPAWHGYTPLHVAANIGNVRAVKMLINAGAAHGLADEKKNTALHLTSNPAIVEVLLNAGAEQRVPNCNNKTVLKQAIEQRPFIVEKILNAGIATEGDAKDVAMKVYFHFDYIKDENYEVGLLHEMKSAGHDDFLKHPLCEAFLHLKWINVCLIIYLKLMIFASAVIALTTLNCLKKYSESHPHEYNTMYLEYCSWLMLMILLFISAIELLTLGAYFLGNIKKWIEVIYIICAIILLKAEGLLGSLQSHAWVVILMVGWSEIYVLLGHIPSIGIYVLMMQKVSL